MKVLLVNPLNLHKRSYVVIPNVSLGYLASALRRSGHEVSLLDCVKDRVGFSGFSSRLADRAYDVVGFNTFTPAFSAVKEYARRARMRLPRSLIVVGGPHPTFEPEETLREIPEADFAFVGEAEEGLPMLVDAFGASRPLDGSAGAAALEEIPGLVWRHQGGEVRKNPRRFIEDLDKNGIPSWDLVQPETYPVAPNGIFCRHRFIAPVIATRGCPYPCTFCGAGRSLGRKVRKRSIGNLMEEIDLLAGRHGIKEIHIMDDNFTFDRGYAQAFCEALIEARKGIFWALPNGVRLDSLDAPLLALMERSGCYSMAVGIESGNQHVLDHIKKHLTLEVVEEKVKLIKRASRIRVTGFFILGYPIETRQDMDRTIRFALRLPLDRANFFNYSPFPGSAMYEELKARRKLGALSYDDLYIHSISYSPDGLSLKEMSSYPLKAHLRFYLRPRILFNLAREIKSLDQIEVIARRAGAILLERFKR